MTTARILAALAVSSLVACSSSGDTQPRGLADDGEGSAAAAPDTNPEGVAYPTGNIGTAVGQRIANYKFLGYPDGNPESGLAPVSLANYFDPNGTVGVKIIHIQAAGSWCTYCRQEMKVVTPLKDELAARKVVWVLSLAEGPTQGQPSTAGDLDQWIASYKAPFPHVLDPGNKNLGQFYDAAALPWNANIDARTMTILSAGVGATTTKDALLKDLDAAIAKAGTIQ